jgi:eukaryotic-like serine/threonine-protein kinase
MRGLSGPLAGILLVAGAFLCYFALLVYCDVVRPVNPGFEADPSEAGFVVVTTVRPGSPSALAGLAVGDRLIAINGVTIVDSDSWGALGASYEMGVSMPVVVERAGASIHLQMLLPPEPMVYWRTRVGGTLLAIRAAQLITALAGLLIAVRRPRDPVALTASWFLLTCAVFVIALPLRVVMVWRELPIPIRELFWLPYASGLAIGPILLTFVTLFPARVPYAAHIQTATWAVAGIALASPLYNAMHLLYRGTELRSIGPRSLLLFTVVWASLVAAVVVSVWNYRRITDLNERRRLRAVVAGIVVAVLPGFSAVAYYWLPKHTNQAQSIFESPALGIVAVALLAAPLSITYAVLRHRLFDVTFIIRKWVRYLLARSLIRSLLPALAVWLAVDFLSHRHETISAVLQRHRTMYIVAALAAGAILIWNRRWLDAIDRRFFRERHLANVVLREVAEQVRRAGSLDHVAPRVVAKIESVMHPEFAALLVRGPGRDVFKAIASAPAASAPDDLGADSKLAALVRVLEAPLDTSEDGDTLLRRRLPPADLDYVRRARIETLIPVITHDDQFHALLALGPKRSEEPYAQEDYDVLVAIAENLALLVARSAPRREAPTLEECPACGACFDGGSGVCASDGRPLAPRALPRTLADRYRLDRRLAAGGMGTVYEALDTALERRVAAKVIRENLISDERTIDRFVEEAKSAARLREHRHVVTVYDFGVIDGRQPFLIMELLVGRTLRQILEESGAMRTAAMLSIFQGVCSAVSAAHRRGLIHRDLKPENIFLADDEAGAVPKVLDFGIAKPVSVAASVTRRQTDHGVLVGTLEYMSPEQLRGEPSNRSWDLWSLAVIALEMLTGKLPGAPSLPGVVTWDPAEPLRGSRPRSAQVLSRALSIDHARRPADARALFGELELALRADGEPHDRESSSHGHMQVLRR